MAQVDEQVSPATPYGELSPDSRFELRRRLGEGSFGVVYEAYDKVRRGPVALKWLRYADAEQVFHFKNEFRSLAEISHPSLVQLFDLESDGDRWFFTMELVRGVPVPEFFRPDQLPPGPETLRAQSSKVLTRLARGEATPNKGVTRPKIRRDDLDVDANEVRAVFRELALGVMALHECGKLHRDLKCQNVLVTPDRRVVLLDFGMVRELGPTSRDPRDLSGTPLYMAPELIGGQSAGPESDWYSFGVMLFRALTDDLPFDGRMYAVMAMKQTREAPRASERVAGVPSDLDELCAKLLSRDPKERPNGQQVLEALGGGEIRERISYPSVEAAEIFVGRRRELRALENARHRSRGGRPTAVFVHGPSGIGKTSLVRHYLERLSMSDPQTLILRGRCFERESLPYKALDEIVDQLTNYLLLLPTAVITDLVPESMSDLARVFPALMRVPAFQQASAPADEAPDPQEQRRRAGQALETLLRKLCEVRDVVISIDDLHWGDRDSAQLIRPMLTDPDAPPVLWLGTYRTDGATVSPFVQAMEEAQDFEAFFVDVNELSDEAARTLLELRLAETARDEKLLDQLASEAAGSPLLIDLLVRHVRAGGESSTRNDLEAVLRGRLEALPELANQLLAVLAVRGRPASTGLLAKVLEVDGFDGTVMTQLRNAKLVRANQESGEEELELYHDRIREAVTGSIADDEERDLHARIAAALADEPEPDPESLALHYRGAGDLARAFEHTLAAAKLAEDALAFERAADRLESALELRPRAEKSGATVAEDELSLRVRLGDALRNAGRGTEAARAYLRASRQTSGRVGLELRRLAAEQHIFSGHLDEGRALMRAVLEEVGMSMPENPARVLAEFLARRAQVRLRGTRFKERREADISEDERFRIDVCWSLAVGLAMIDPLRGGIFQARHMVMALDAGDLRRIARAVAVEVPFAATSGTKNDKRTSAMAKLGRELAAREGSPYIRGLLASSTGGSHWLCGRWNQGRQLEEEALSILRGECSGVAWQIGSSTVVLLDTLWRMGEWAELFERWPSDLDDAVARGDLLLEIYVRIKFLTLSHLAAGRPDDAIRESQDALARWSQPTFQLLHFWDLFVQTEAQLYAGRVEAARERVRAGAPAVRRSGLLQLQLYDVTWRDLEGRVAVACAQHATGRRRKQLLDEARDAIKKLDRSGAAWSRGMPALLRAGVASVEDTVGRDTRELDKAERGFEAADMTLHARVTRAVASQRRRDYDAYDREIEALQEVGLAEPQRWLEVLAPGSWNR